MRRMIEKLVKEQGTCFLGSITEEGYPMIRAMLQPIKNRRKLFLSSHEYFFQQGAAMD
ncbi:pyridoxamine 5'-phosphate oxidase family protein [Enterococcus sp. AZ163]|uniref:pyridoxamine 5'-phosphate oxidase family protein n=1 Tax=Enterococcus sp. AZ163 TaxID=2774638 RepID=UPI003D2B97EA